MTTTERIEELARLKGLNRKDLADITGVSYRTLTNAIANDTDLGIENLKKVITAFPEWDKDYILFGNESHISRVEDQRSEYRQLRTINEDPEGKDIPFVDGEFFATISPAMEDVITLKRDTFVRIPMFSRGEFAIQVTGNSMKGYINHGDWIIIRKLERLDKIIYGEVYVVVSKYDNHRTIKFIKEDQDDYSLLWLVPYNIEQFEPQSIEKEDVLEIYLVIGSFKKIGN